MAPETVGPPPPPTVAAASEQPRLRRPGTRQVARVQGWGRAVGGLAFRYQPRTTEDIREIYEMAQREKLPIALRGAGRSYGDAATLPRGIVLDLSKMSRILQWDAATGVIEVEPGCTLREIWQHTIADGWWPHVVSGTMHTTAGGCASANIHGKNNWAQGTFGEHVIEFDLLTPAGEHLTCRPDQHTDLFYAAISGFGMLGCFTRLVIQLKKVESGLLRVEAFHTPNLQALVDEFEVRAPEADYLVGWIDCTARGKGLGRGVVHAAWYTRPGEVARPADSLNVGAQQLPPNLLGVLPKSMMHLLMRPFINNLGVRLVNTAKWIASRYLTPQSHIIYQSHGAFAFLLDYVPGWERAYGPGGLIQYQSFVPKAAAVATFERMLAHTQRRGLPSYLGVFKKHRPDPFLLTHAVDGYSLALDFRVTARNRDRLWAMARELDEMVLEAGGRFYFAKDATLTPETASRVFGTEALARLAALKQQHDPHGVLQTALSNRLFASHFAASSAAVPAA